MCLSLWIFELHQTDRYNLDDNLHSCLLWSLKDVTYTCGVECRREGYEEKSMVTTDIS